MTNHNRRVAKTVACLVSAIIACNARGSATAQTSASAPVVTSTQQLIIPPPAPLTVVDSKGKFVGYFGIFSWEPAGYEQIAFSAKGVWTVAAALPLGRGLYSPSNIKVNFTGPGCTGTPYMEYRGLLSVALIGVPPGQTDVFIYAYDSATSMNNNVNFASFLAGGLLAPDQPLNCISANAPGESGMPAVSIKASSLGWTPPFKIKSP